MSLLSVKSELERASLQANSNRWEKYQAQKSQGKVDCICDFMPLWMPMLTEAPSVPPPITGGLTWTFITDSLWWRSLPSHPNACPRKSMRPSALAVWVRISTDKYWEHDLICCASSSLIQKRINTSFALCYQYLLSHPLESWKNVSLTRNHRIAFTSLQL